MASPDLVIGYHKLDTEFFTGHVQHTTFHSDASQGRRRVKVVKKWYRGRELGRGSFGTVFLEWSEKGECRAVKEIAREKIDYRRELMAMAMLAKHDALFVQLFGWYESEYYIHIAMEYINYGHLRNYLKVERSESEAKAITRQLLEGLVVIHQEGFAHRDLKPENIFVVSASPVWVKIGDFGLAKLVRDGTAFRTQTFSIGYFAPEMGITSGGDSSEYTNSVDVWAVGCIAHEVLTRVLPFRNLFELSSYCTRPEFPRKYMLLKNISQEGMEIVERMLALPPERRIAPKEALDSEWLRVEGEGLEGVGTEDSAGPALSEIPVPSGAEATNGDSLPGNSKEVFRNRVLMSENPILPLTDHSIARRTANSSGRVPAMSVAGGVTQQPQRPSFRTAYPNHWLISENHPHQSHPPDHFQGSIFPPKRSNAHLPGRDAVQLPSPEIGPGLLALNTGSRYNSQNTIVQAPPPPPPLYAPSTDSSQPGQFTWSWAEDEAWREYVHSISSMAGELDPTETYSASTLIALNRDRDNQVNTPPRAGPHAHAHPQHTYTGAQQLR